MFIQLSAITELFICTKIHDAITPITQAHNSPLVVYRSTILKADRVIKLKHHIYIYINCTPKIATIILQLGLFSLTERLGLYIFTYLVLVLVIYSDKR